MSNCYTHIVDLLIIYYLLFIIYCAKLQKYYKEIAFFNYKEMYIRFYCTNNKSVI